MSASDIRQGFKNPLFVPVLRKLRPAQVFLAGRSFRLSSPPDATIVATVTITRLARFSAAHRLHNPGLSDDENARIFGKCNSPNYHGHNYTLEVSIAGTPDPRTGYVLDFGDLDRIVDRACIDHLDHRNLDLDVPFLRGILSTAENIVVACWAQLEPALRPATLVRLRLWETENNYVEYHGH